MTEESQVFIVGGIAFYDIESAKIAQSELKRIEVIDEKMDYRDVNGVAVIYEKARENRIFKTPIGISYMMRLQNFLAQEQYPGVLEMPIHVETAFGMQDKTGQAAKEQGEGQQNQSDNIWKARLENSKAETQRQKKKFRLSVRMNVLLVVLVIALFIISQTGNNPTVLNYKSKIISQYSEWQQELSEREQEIRQREAELGIE